MKKIRNFVINTISFFNSKYLLKYLFSISICLLGLFLFGMFTNDTLSNLLGIIFGFVISHLLLGIFTLISAKLEDPTKVTDDQKKLLKIYSHKSCSKEVELNNTKTTILYKDLLVNNNYNIKVVDEPENIFTPDDFIMDNFHPLLSAHRFSSISNRNTVRLNSCKQTSKNEYTLTLGRSTYFNHLITNRVADYKLESGISIRDYYEFGPDISSPEKSKMSNHIGIIALIYLKDGELLLPRRKDTSTISKNKITSSIAMPLRIPETNNISTEYLLKDCIIDGIVSRTKLDRHYLKEDEIDIEFWVVVKKYMNLVSHIYFIRLY
ncbi:MAG: hypothetical protein IKA31_05505 [Clostridia bacterium]|nr:hypothetical protein [Clostridia bacterium]